MPLLNTFYEMQLLYRCRKSYRTESNIRRWVEGILLMRSTFDSPHFVGPSTDSYNYAIKSIAGKYLKTNKRIVRTYILMILLSDWISNFANASQPSKDFTYYFYYQRFWKLPRRSPFPLRTSLCFQSLNINNESNFYYIFKISLIDIK